jgi:hypothetical protein
MTVVVDQPSTLIDDSFRDVIMQDERISEVLILQADFEQLPESKKININEMVALGKVGFVPLSQIIMDDVCNLRLLYDGISIEGLTLLTFCKSRRHSFQSYDSALLNAAKELNVDMFEFMTDRVKKIFNKDVIAKRIK